MKAKNCKSGRYTASLPSTRLPFSQCRSNSDINLGPPSSANGEIIVPVGHYGSITSREDGGTITFQSGTGENIYRIKSLDVRGGVLRLAPGQYWIENLNIASKAIVVVPHNYFGSVAIFVGNDFTLSNTVQTYTSDSFLIYGYSDIDIAATTTFRGHAVAEGRLSLGRATDVVGALTSDYISVPMDARVNYDATAHKIDVIPNCGEDAPNPAVPAQCPAEQSNVEGLTYRTYDARAWSTGNNSPVNHGQFNDLIDQVRKTTYQIGESIETNFDQKGDGINPHSDEDADQDLYLGLFEGYIDAPETGEYTFAIDGDDAIELLIDGEVITGFYNRHGTCNCLTKQGKVSLEKGTHTIELRLHEATGQEAFRLYWQPPSANSLTIVPKEQLLTCPAPQFEFGQVELDGNGVATVYFKNSYAAAPVVMAMPTIDITGTNDNSDRPSTIRVNYLTDQYAQIQQINSNPPWGLNKKMTKIDYFVMEPGYRFIERGSALQAGSVSTTFYQGKNTTGPNRGYQSIDFDHNFGARPAMIGQALTRANNRFITTVINDVDLNGSDFNIAIEGSEVSGGIWQPELLGYAAGLGRGTISVADEEIIFKFGHALNHGSGNSVRTLSQQCAFNNSYFEKGFLAQPITIANKNQRNGGDGGWVRRCLKDEFNNDVSFALDEDLNDGERQHIAESIGYFAFEIAAEPPAVNHYRISFDSGALSCAAKPITVQACADADCTSLLNDPASVVITKNGADYTTADVVGSAQVNIWHPQGGLVTLGLGNTVPSGEFFCYIDGNLVDNSQCQLSFENSGIYFDIDDLTACKNSANFEMYAVKKDELTQQCTPLFANQTKPISMAFNYITPDAAEVNATEKLTINSLHSPETSKDIAGGDSQELQVHFDANGKALLNVNYPEAGKVELAATLTETINSPDGSTSETLVLEHSDQFVSKPDGFHFFNGSGVNGCKGASCNILEEAGDDFAMNVKAVCGADDGTSYKDRSALKNFRFSDMKIKSVLQAPLLSNGDDKDGTLGTLGLAEISFTKTNSAPLTVTNQTYSEVGAMSLALDGDVNYLGTTIEEAKSTSDLFGRFTPYFLRVEANSPKLQAQCNSFTYMDQPFGFQSGSEPTIAVKGMNKAGAETGNYQIGDWWRYKGNQWLNRTYSDTSGATSVDGAALQILDASPASEQVNYYPQDDTNLVRRAYLIDTELHYARTSSLAIPFNAQFDLQLPQAGVTDSDGICYRDSADSACLDFTFNDIAKDDAFAMRYGRFILQNGYGPSTEELRLAVNTQFVNSGGVWEVNSADMCSEFNTTSATESAEVGLYLTPDTGLEAVKGYTQTGGTGQSGMIDDGNSFIYFPAPNADGEVGLQQHVDKWLKWYWNFDSTSGLQDPRATANFGTYRGHDRIIYWREVN
nr:DUF6701 domain-containing protein [Shewanella sairae]